MKGPFAPIRGRAFLPSPLAGEGGRRPDEGYLSAATTARRSAPIAQPLAAYPSSGATRHLAARANALVRCQHGEKAGWWLPLLPMIKETHP